MYCFYKLFYKKDNVINFSFINWTFTYIYQIPICFMDNLVPSCHNQTEFLL